MSLKTIITCSLCNEELKRQQGGKYAEEGGVGVIFRSVKSGDFVFGKPRDTQGAHICLGCLYPLLEELTKVFS